MVSVLSTLRTRHSQYQIDAMNVARNDADLGNQSKTGRRSVSTFV